LLSLIGPHALPASLPASLPACQVADRLFEAFDKDRSGSFDEAEFLSFLGPLLDSKSALAKELSKAAGLGLKEGGTREEHIRQVRCMMVDAGACRGCMEHLAPPNELCMHKNNFRVWFTQSFALFAPERFMEFAEHWTAAARC
jgi:hypothetical protein